MKPNGARAHPQSDGSTERSWLVFRLGSHVMCASSLDVQGIIEPVRVTPLPFTPDYMLGTFIFRDSVASAISLRKRLGVREGEDSSKGPFVVARIGNELAAFWVDEVKEVLDSHETSWQPMPDTLDAAIFDKYTIRNDELILHTSFEALLHAEGGERLPRWTVSGAGAPKMEVAPRPGDRPGAQVRSGGPALEKPPQSDGVRQASDERTSSEDRSKSDLQAREHEHLAADDRGPMPQAEGVGVPVAAPAEDRAESKADTGAVAPVPAPESALDVGGGRGPADDSEPTLHTEQNDTPDTAPGVERPEGEAERALRSDVAPMVSGPYLAGGGKHAIEEREVASVTGLMPQPAPEGTVGTAPVDKRAEDKAEPEPGSEAAAETPGPDLARDSEDAALEGERESAGDGELMPQAEHTGIADAVSREAHAADEVEPEVESEISAAALESEARHDGQPVPHVEPEGAADTSPVDAHAEEEFQPEAGSEFTRATLESEAGDGDHSIPQAEPEGVADTPPADAHAVDEIKPGAAGFVAATIVGESEAHNDQPIPDAEPDDTPHKPLGDAGAEDEAELKAGFDVAAASPVPDSAGEPEQAHALEGEREAVDDSRSMSRSEPQAVEVLTLDDLLAKGDASSATEKTAEVAPDAPAEIHLLDLQGSTPGPETTDTRDREAALVSQDDAGTATASADDRELIAQPEPAAIDQLDGWQREIEVERKGEGHDVSSQIDEYAEPARVPAPGISDASNEATLPPQEPYAAAEELPARAPDFRTRIPDRKREPVTHGMRAASDARAQGRAKRAAWALAVAAAIAAAIWSLVDTDSRPPAEQFTGASPSVAGKVSSTGVDDAPRPAATAASEPSPAASPAPPEEPQAGTTRIVTVKTEAFTMTVDRPKTRASDPQAAPSRETPAPAAAAPKSSQEVFVHVVVRGDTLWEIAKKHLGDPYRYPELVKLSGIRNPNLIYPGDIVRIEKAGTRR